MTTDIFTQEIIKDSIVALGDEMFNTMIRTSMSPIIYESTDFAVGATDAAGNLLAQGNGVSGFLATLDTAVQSLLTHYKQEEIYPGDVFMTNCPYEGGGTHLSDVVILVPVFAEKKLIAWTVNKAHWTEVGGTYAGSVSTMATEIYQEGLHFKFIKLFDKGQINQAVVEIIRHNVRLPDSTLGDMHAGVAAAKVGANRVLEIVDKYGLDDVIAAMNALLDYGERMTLAELKNLPHGVYEAEDIVEEDGIGNGPFKVKVKVTITKDNIITDFTGTDPQAPGPINCSYAGLVTSVRCIVKAITNSDIPANGGSFRALEIICPQGTFISAVSPAPVSLYYETLCAVMDVVWKALAPVLPERLPSGHYRSIGGTFISGIHPDTNDLFVVGEPLAGGWGATQERDGDGGQFCSLNGETFNIPTELFESRYGVRVEQYGFHNEDGGAGEYRGGKGVVLDYRIVAKEAFLTFGVSRSKSKPWALEGGQEGSNNYAIVIRNDGTEERHHMCSALLLKEGELARIYTGTGGGFGDPKKRSHDSIKHDLKNEFITSKQAEQFYGYKA